MTATAVFAYMPGPSTLYAAARTLAGGRRAGWLAAAGIHTGGYVHVLAAAFGLAILFSVTPMLYLALKIIGGAYLIWLGVSLLLTQATSADAEIHLPGKSSKRDFWDSALVEILNPKTALFYLAFLPQFTDSGAVFPIWLQLLLLGTIVNAMFSTADVLCVILAAKIQNLIKHNSRVGNWPQRIGGAILIGLGTKLMVQQR